MRDIMRLITTLFIWGAMAGIIIPLMSSPTGAISRASGDTLILIVLVIAAAGAISTAAVWTGDSARNAASTTLARRSKGKRHRPSRVERLVESLDDDEVYDLEALLLARDADQDRFQAD